MSILARWPQEVAPGMRPLAATLTPEPVPAPPERTTATGRTTLAIAGAAGASVIGAGAALLIFAAEHGWLG